MLSKTEKMDYKKPFHVQRSSAFPYKIHYRLLAMSRPRRVVQQSTQDMPALTRFGVRQSALNAQISNRVNDAAYPYLRRCLQLKRMYKNLFSETRLERLDRIIEATNNTIYSKLANCTVDLKKQQSMKDNTKKKRGWTDTDWKKHMDYISNIAVPKKEFPPEPVKRGHRKPLEELATRINQLASVPDFKVYKRLSQEDWYRDPIKVRPNALKYVPTERIKKLATPRIVHTEEM